MAHPPPVVPPPPLDAQRERRLVAAIDRGNLAAFEELYREYRDWVYRLALRFTGHGEDALDVLQETFAYFSGKFPGFQLQVRLSTFLYPAVRNLAERARNRRGRYASEEEAIEGLRARESAVKTPQEEALASVLRLVPDAQREVLTLRFVDDFSLDEIATTLEIPLGTVKSRLHSALETLRKDERTRSLLAD